MTIVVVKQLENGDAYVEIPPKMLKQLGWKENQELVYTFLEDGGIAVSAVKQETDENSEDNTELLEVNTLSSFRLTYAMRVPKGLTDEQKLELVKLTLQDDTICDVSQEHNGEEVQEIKVVDEDHFVSEQVNGHNYLSEEVVKNSIIDVSK